MPRGKRFTCKENQPLRLKETIIKFRPCNREATQIFSSINLLPLLYMYGEFLYDIMSVHVIDWSVLIMRVKCVICDKIESIEDETLMAKRLRNRPIHTYMCQECNNRIEERTNARKSTGNFRLYRTIQEDDTW